MREPQMLENQKSPYRRVECHQRCRWTQHHPPWSSKHDDFVLFKGTQPAVLTQEFKKQFQDSVHECSPMSFQFGGCKCFLGRESTVFFRFSKLSMAPRKG